MTDQYETRAVPSYAHVTVHEPGWEPFAVGDGWLWLRRRVYPAATVARINRPPADAAMRTDRHPFAGLGTEPIPLSAAEIEALKRRME